MATQFLYFNLNGKVLGFFMNINGNLFHLLLAFFVLLLSGCASSKTDTTTKPATGDAGTPAAVDNLAIALPSDTAAATPSATPSTQAASSEPMVEADSTFTEQYVIKSGDSLWKIARNHNTSVAKLKATNKLTSDVIRPGKTLLVPPGFSGGTSSAVAETPVTTPTPVEPAPVPVETPEPAPVDPTLLSPNPSLSPATETTTPSTDMTTPSTDMITTPTDPTETPSTETAEPAPSETEAPVEP